jgi:hypothetical protein
MSLLTGLDPLNQLLLKEIIQEKEVMAKRFFSLLIRWNKWNDFAQTFVLLIKGNNY